MSTGPGLIALTVIPRSAGSSASVGQLVHSALADHVGKLAGHRAEVLTGGEQHDPPVRPVVVTGGGKGLGEQDGGAGVHGPRPVELLGGDRLEGQIRTVCMVRDEGVNRTERIDRPPDHQPRSGGIAEVGLDLPKLIRGAPELVDQGVHATRIRPPRLLGVAR